MKRDREKARETERDRESQNRPFHTRITVFDCVWVRGSVCAGDIVCVMCVSGSVRSERDTEGERDRE